MRARLARRVCVRAGGGGRGRRAVRGVPERRLRRRTRAGRERLGCPRPPPRLLGPPRSAPRPRLPCRLRATPACRARGCAARGPVRAVAPSCCLHRPRAAGTATPPPGLDAARNAVVRRGELGGELERAGYEAAGGGGSTRSSLRLIGASAGLFRGPDRCCREHDQCWAQITALQFNYGIRNYRLHTVSHCDCDTRFRQCLLAINDTVSNIIGVTFFNLLEVPCFVLEESEECIQWHWWGGLARCLHRARDCSDMDLAVLADRITMDCFVLELPAACSPSRESQHSSCTMMTRAVLVPAQQLKKILRRWGPLRVSSKAKHLHWKTHARGGILCEQCQHLVVEQTPA